VALATPPGQGAIAIVRMSGAEAIDICNRVFPARDLSKEPGHTIHHGSIRDGDQVVDEVLVSLFKVPKSYTKENLVEISCHGSNYIVQQIIQVLLKHGARLAQPGEFTKRAFLHGQFDLAQAEAVADLIASDSQASHRTALNQMRGGFSKEIAGLRESLIHFASMIELELDFSEEDVEFASREQLKELVTKIQQVVRPLIDSFQLGNAIKKGVPIVIAGKPNAGKSTLLNALLNEEKAIVSDIPGTTRDFIEDEITIEGIRFRFIDTAGLRDTEDTIEALGVERTKQQLRKAAVIVYMMDLADSSLQELQQEQQQVHTELQQEPASLTGRHTDVAPAQDDEQSQNETQTHAPTPTPIIFVGNKVDKISAEMQASLEDSDMVLLSALNKENLDQLKTRILEAVSLGKVGEDQTLVTSLRHYQSLRGASNALNDVLKSIEQGVTNDLLALDIRTALHHLGEITGEITTDDLLQNIFSKFCIGK
jgi:tRNA modification GTPase